MRLLLHTLLVAGGILLSPVVAAPSEPLTLETIQTTFQHTRAAGNSVCILLDGWQIAFLSPDGQKIGAVIVMEHEDAEGHDFNLSRVVSRLASLTGMGTPESMDFEDEELEYSLLVDRDVLDELAEIKICTAYRINGKEEENFPADTNLLNNVEAIYETLPGWQCDTTKAKCWADLPENAKKYLLRVAELLDAKIGIVSVGPDRDQTFSTVDENI